MGDISKMVLDGTLCDLCGGLVGGEAPGYPRTCHDCPCPPEPSMTTPRTMLEAVRERAANPEPMNTRTYSLATADRSYLLLLVDAYAQAYDRGWTVDYEALTALLERKEC